MNRTAKTPDMVRRELWVTLLAYNLIRQLIATSAALHGKTPRRLGFTLACQTVLASWMRCATRSCSNSAALYATILAHIAANEVANRPGRIEPRVLGWGTDRGRELRATNHRRRLFELLNIVDRRDDSQAHGDHQHGPPKSRSRPQRGQRDQQRGEVQRIEEGLASVEEVQA